MRPTNLPSLATRLPNIDSDMSAKRQKASISLRKAAAVDMGGEAIGESSPSSRGVFPVTPKPTPWKHPLMANWLQQRVLDVLKSTGIPKTTWSAKAGLGSTYVRDLLRAASPNPAADRLRKLAEAVDLQADYFMQKEEADEKNERSSSNQQSSVGPLHATIPAQREEKDLPFLATSPGRRVGEWLMAKASDGDRFRPGGLFGRTDVFCCFVQTPEMGDRYPVGELIYVEKNRPAAPGDDMLIEMKGEEDGRRRVLLRRLVDRSGDHIKVRQLDPPKTTSIPNDEISQIYRVLRGVDLS